MCVAVAVLRFCLDMLVLGLFMTVVTCAALCVHLLRTVSTDSSRTASCDDWTPLFHSWFSAFWFCLAAWQLEQGNHLAIPPLLFQILDVHCHGHFSCRLWSFTLYAAMLRHYTCAFQCSIAAIAFLNPVLAPKHTRGHDQPTNADEVWAWIKKHGTSWESDLREIFTALPMRSQKSASLQQWARALDVTLRNQDNKELLEALLTAAQELHASRHEDDRPQTAHDVEAWIYKRGASWEFDLHEVLTALPMHSKKNASPQQWARALDVPFKNQHNHIRVPNRGDTHDSAHICVLLQLMQAITPAAASFLKFLMLIHLANRSLQGQMLAFAGLTAAVCRCHAVSHLACICFTVSLLLITSDANLGWICVAACVPLYSPKKTSAKDLLTQWRNFIAEHGDYPRETKGHPGENLAKRVRIHRELFNKAQWQEIRKSKKALPPQAHPLSQGDPVDDKEKDVQAFIQEYRTFCLNNPGMPPSANRRKGASLYKRKQHLISIGLLQEDQLKDATPDAPEWSQLRSSWQAEIDELERRFSTMDDLIAHAFEQDFVCYTKGKIRNRKYTRAKLLDLLCLKNCARQIRYDAVHRFIRREHRAPREDIASEHMLHFILTDGLSHHGTLHGGLKTKHVRTDDMLGGVTVQLHLHYSYLFFRT